ncbi:HflX family GTPase, partial [Halorubrum sp. SS5]
MSRDDATTNETAESIETDAHADDADAHTNDADSHTTDTSPLDPADPGATPAVVAARSEGEPPDTAEIRDLAAAAG